MSWHAWQITYYYLFIMYSMLIFHTMTALRLCLLQLFREFTFLLILLQYNFNWFTFDMSQLCVCCVCLKLFIFFLLFKMLLVTLNIINCHLLSWTDLIEFRVIIGSVDVDLVISELKILIICTNVIYQQVTSICC